MKKYTVLMELPDSSPGDDLLWEQVKARNAVEAADAARRLANDHLRSEEAGVNIDDIGVRAVITGWPEIELDPYHNVDYICTCDTCDACATCDVVTPD